jgi:hypothetical protein
LRDGRLFGQFSLLASLSRTVISRVNPLALYYFPGMRLAAFARAPARKKGPRCAERSAAIPTIRHNLSPLCRAGARAKGLGSPARK